MALPKIKLSGLSGLSKLGKTINGHEDVNEFDSIPIEDIYSKEQPRKVFEKIDELAQSLKEQGQLQPIVVNEDGHGRFIIEQGERRFRAAQIAGLTHMYAMITKSDDEIKRKINQITENVQRDDMKLYELSQSVGEIIESGMSLKELARRLGKKESYISALYSVTNLPEPLQKLAAEQHIQDPVSLRRLKNIYQVNPDCVIQQIELWSKADNDDGENGETTPFVVTRAMVNAFAKRLKDEKETPPAPVVEEKDFSPATKPVEAFVAEPTTAPTFDRPLTEKAAAEGVEVPKESAPATVKKTTPKQLDLLEGCCSEQPAHIRVAVRWNGREGYLTPCVVPPTGKLCLTLDPASKPVLVDVAEVQILGVVSQQ